MRRGFLNQIQKAIKEVSNNCNIIVSVRTYDALKSPKLLSLFGSSTNNDDSINSRKEIITELDEKEIVDAIKENIRLLNFYYESSIELKEILKIPFFLVLLESIISSSSNNEVDEIKKYKSESQLLKVFWQKKLVNVDDHISKEIFLTKFTTSLIKARSLNISKKEFSFLFPQFSSSTFDYLRSENIIDEISINNTRLAYSHNILFDYAVSFFCMTEKYEELFEFIQADPTRPFFLRPSFIYFFTSIWYANRKEFWAIYWRLFETETKEIQLLVRLILNGIIVSEYSSVVELSSVLSISSTQTKSIAIRNLLQSIRFIRNKSNLQDVDLLLNLSEHLNPIFIFDFAFLLSRSIDTIEDEEGILKCGRASRALLTYILANRTSENRFFLDRIGSSRGIDLVCKTYATDKESSRNILALIFDMLKESDFEIFYFSSLSENVKLILPHDPDFVAKVYEVIFDYTEISEEKTQMGSSVIMQLTSSRRQDYELCYFRLEQFFPEFLVKAPKLAIPLGLKIVNDYVVKEKLMHREHIESEIFKYREWTCKYIIDLSSIWGENINYHKPVGIAIKIIDYVDDLISKNINDYKNIIIEYIKNSKVGFTWKILFKLAVKYPSQLVEELYPLLTIPSMLKGPDTSYEVRQVIEKVCEFLTNEQIKSIEEIAFLIYDDSKINNISSVLSRIPANRLQLTQSKKFMTENKAVENEPGIKYFSSVETYTSDMWLRDKGVDMSNPENEQLSNSSNQLEIFNHKWLNGEPDISEYQQYLDIAKITYNKLIDNVTDIQEDLFFSVLNEITKTLVIVSRNLNGVKQEDFSFIKSVIIYSFHYKSKYDDDNIDNSPSRGWSPTPKIEASEALISLYVFEKSDQNIVLLKEAINDQNSVVRYHAVKSLIKIADIDYNEYWLIIIYRLSIEDDSFVYTALLNNLKFQVEKIKEQAKVIIDLAYSKDLFFTWQNDFIESFTVLLLWLFKRHKINEAEEVLLQAYNKPYFCKTVIFKIFENLHPSYPQNEFVEHPENYEPELYIIKRYINDCRNVLHQLNEEDFKTENKNLQDALQIIDEIILRIFFQFDAARVGRSNHRLPINEENRQAFYFLVKPIYEQIILLSSGITGKGLITGHTAHYFIESLNKVLSYDAKSILSMVSNVTKYTSVTGYTFDSLAIREIVQISEKLLADHRDLLLDDESFKNLIDLLDIYINSGWVEALQLLWRLDEIFR